MLIYSTLMRLSITCCQKVIDNDLGREPWPSLPAPQSEAAHA